MLLALPLALHSTARGQDGDPDGLDDPVVPAVSPAQLKAKLADYRSPKTDPAKRIKIAEELIALGPDGAKAVVPEMAKEVAARQVPSLGRWRRFEPARAELMRAQLDRIAKTPGLSKDVFEQASKSLA